MYVLTLHYSECSGVWLLQWMDKQEKFEKVVVGMVGINIYLSAHKASYIHHSSKITSVSTGLYDSSGRTLYV